MRSTLQTMRSTLLKSIYVLIVLRTLVMGFPVHTDTDNKISLKENSIVEGVIMNDADASVKSYMCVHIPPELQNCNFVSYHITTENSWVSGNGRMKKGKRELLNDNRENMLHSLKKVLGTGERFPRQKLGKIIYEIQRCVPHRLPFTLPWCTKEDLADKENEIYRLIPFVRKGTSTKSLLLPDYNI
ncbi:uncharacterized protein LOC116840713 [Odontomachus brunneus]|uniref:uncharacterized protein LOC116840713 n=1 Tax=Odontomachus brunneus TaxID=486640 RepID=UPI0013F2827B|nr:uncharacterized protein LOC116840713 [Odontomachus brunneus]XP_032663684.1 uncharacterized protein LOC116840713 [Odontomachus brunneus]XP_032663685.1 uncharacterized protein LOC116840713 [Odontomachus brunneus]XP_032663686.1 uncharacterized protein LOC116840713 [Odontomachus brunneus]XP_032663687.1 uncharacterized protein LOC116840713 [Odontomachus brunneus]XP_032663688.1 uncharacterized protein LOC116840713 [Odontomachus brunneus]